MKTPLELELLASLKKVIPPLKRLTISLNKNYTLRLLKVIVNV
jgi:hypothetical protein